MSQNAPQPGESDMRRRAAWLLGMLVLAAALFVTLMVAFLGTSNGSHHTAQVDAPQLTEVPSAPGQSTTGHSSTGTGTSTGSSSSSGGAASSSTSAAPGATSCPGHAVCILNGDIGNAVAAINSYRTQHGQSTVPVAVSPAAQKCALNNGSNCAGGWAETELATPDGKQAVTKILQFAHLAEPTISSVGVGWAYDPQAKEYYFAVVLKQA
jgi:hypothetical protein